MLISKVSEIEVSYKTAIATKDRYKIMTAECAVKLLRQLWANDSTYCESVYLLLCNSAVEVIGWKKIASGSATGCVFDVKLILGIALKGLAHSIILAHNHPSGSLIPSKADIDITGRVKNACSFMDIRLNDHIIITEDSYYSFANAGTL